MKTSTRCATGAIAVALLATTACTTVVDENRTESGTSDSRPVSTDASPTSLADAMRTDALVGHLQQLQKIADTHNGNRAAGTAGYDASVDYVAGKLRSAGFEVQTPEFDIDDFKPISQSLTAGGRPVEVKTLAYSPSTPADGITGRLVAVPADDSPGCQSDDYKNLDVKGAVVLVPRGKCPFGAKQKVAADLGAAAIVVSNNADGPISGGTLGDSKIARIPSAGISREDGEALAQAGGDVTLKIEAKTTTTKSRNVIAQTKTGDQRNVVMAGSHLDSVPEGPGINDNGTGTAAVLETALQLGSSPKVTNAVRFAWWGGEELGLVGSTAYVDKLSPQQRHDIALYLNFDMLGSPNAGYLVHDGDDSDNTGAPPGPEGSAGIERTLSAYLLQEGVTPVGTDFDGRSDYGPFIGKGIPAGGVFSGAEEKMTADEAYLWGGEVTKPYDPNYHSAGDTLDNVNRVAFTRNSRDVAYSIATYAQSIEGPNGVPAAAQRQAVRGEHE